MRQTIWVIHGPNLNLLGTREPEIYGTTTLADIDNGLAEIGRRHRFSLNSFQSNHEGALVDHIQSASAAGVSYIIINPAAYTHTSVAIRDALKASGIPFIEVHLSNVHSREAFRRHSYLSDLATGVIAGLGARGYRLALEYAIEQLARTDWPPGRAPDKDATGR